MYQINGFLNLSYNDISEEIPIPLNFEELKNIFYKKFNQNSSKSFKFICFINDDFKYIEEKNFSETIKSIQNGELILVLDDNNENQNNFQFNNTNNNPKENDILNIYLKQKTNISLRKLASNSNKVNKINEGVMAKQIDNDPIKQLKEELNNEIKDIVLKYKTLENKYNELLPLNDIVKQLQQENQKKDIIIKKLQNEIDSIKSQLDNAQEENKTKFKQMSGIMAKIQTNINKLKAIFSDIKCNKCSKYPTEGYKYKCSQCNDYYLCEECQRKNSLNKEHPHIFIKLESNKSNIYYNNTFREKSQIKEIKGINNTNYNLNDNINKYNNQYNNINITNKNQLVINQPEVQHSFECLNKQSLKTQIEEENDFLNMKIILKNNGETQWPRNEAKLVFDQNKNIIGKNIILKPQKPGEQEKYKIDFDNLKMYPAGNYRAGLIFEINGKKYGENIDIFISIKKKADMNINEHIKKNYNENQKYNSIDQEKIGKFKKEFNLENSEITDERIMGALKNFNYDFKDAFASLFNN